MANIINAITTGAGGISTTADASGSIQIATNNGTTAMTIDTSQNVGIGTAIPNSRLHVSSGAVTVTGASSTTARINMFNNAATTGGLLLGQGYASGTDNTGYIFNVSNAPVVFGTNDTERWRIDSGGELSSRSTYGTGSFPLVIGVTGAYPVDRGIAVSNSAGSGIPFIAYTSSTTQAGYILTSGSTIAFVQGSDYRLKENVVAMDKSATLSKLMQVKPVNFDWKDGNELHNYGFLAHELQETFPQAVHGEKDAVNEDGTIKTQSVNLAALIPYLVASIQEQQTIINELKTRIETLEAK